MDVKLVVDWLSTKTVNGEKINRDEVSSALGEVSLMPCVCCGGAPEFLGMIEHPDRDYFSVPEKVARVLFYMVCGACIRDNTNDKIIERVRDFTLQLTN